jgi:hypothetical protein
MQRKTTFNLLGKNRMTLDLSSEIWKPEQGGRFLYAQRKKKEKVSIKNLIL